MISLEKHCEQRTVYEKQLSLNAASRWKQNSTTTINARAHTRTAQSVNRMLSNILSNQLSQHKCFQREIFL